MMRGSGLVLSVISVLLLTSSHVVHGQQGATDGQWRASGGDAGQTRYSPLEQITRENVKDLKVAWTFRMDNFSSPPEIRSQTSPVMANGRVFFTAGAQRAVVAVDAGTGEALWLWKNDEGVRGQKAPRRGSGRGVAYWTDGREERIFTSTPGFRLVALDAKTGHQVGGFGRDGVVDLFTVIDPRADLTGTIGNSSPPVVSGDTIIIGPAQAQGARPLSMKNTKGDVMAFDVRTGKKRWQFHTIARLGEPGHETWLDGSAEYTGNAGVWTPFTVDEELGYVYVFDRVGMTHDDLIDFTPALRQMAIEAIRPYRYGPLYIPPSLMEAADGTKGAIMLPGNRGGANWNAGAVDPDTGYVYVTSVTRPTLLQLVKMPTSDMNYVATALAPPLPTVDGLPLQKPPYGRIVAFDMNKGAIAWQMANGDTPPQIKNHPTLAGLQVPRTGSISHAGLVVTRTLLFAGEGDGGMPMFRAHDKMTGEILWETQIPAGAQTGLPVTYMHGGKQYVVFAAGGTAGAAAQLVAYALPDRP